VLAEGVQNPCFSADILVGWMLVLGDGLSLFGKRKQGKVEKKMLRADGELMRLMADG